MKAKRAVAAVVALAALAAGVSNVAQSAPTHDNPSRDGEYVPHLKGANPSPAKPAHVLPVQTAWPKLASAGPFLLNEIREKVEGRWGAAWQSLHPLDKLVASQAEYVRCEQATPLRPPLDPIRVVRVRRSLFRLHGLARPAWAAAVTVRVELEWYGPRDPIVLEHTFHLIPVNGHWTWLLSPSRYRLYLYDNCNGALMA